MLSHFSPRRTERRLEPRWANNARQMNTHILPALVDGAIPFLGGLYGTFLGFRWIGPKAGENLAYDRRYEMYFRWFKWGGPFLMAFGIFLFVEDIMRQ